MVVSLRAHFFIVLKFAEMSPKIVSILERGDPNSTVVGSVAGYSRWLVLVWEDAPALNDLCRNRMDELRGLRVL